jgi:hypothetical protein
MLSLRILNSKDLGIKDLQYPKSNNSFSIILVCSKDIYTFIIKCYLCIKKTLLIIRLYRNIIICCVQNISKTHKTLKFYKNQLYLNI